MWDFIGAKDDGDDGDNWSFQSNHHHHQLTNTQVVTERMPSCHPNNHVRVQKGESVNQLIALIVLLVRCGVMSKLSDIICHCCRLQTNGLHNDNTEWSTDAAG